VFIPHQTSRIVFRGEGNKHPDHHHNTYLRKVVSVTDGGILATNILVAFFEGARISSCQKKTQDKVACEKI
jgi:hypothetical protein